MIADLNIPRCDRAEIDLVVGMLEYPERVLAECGHVEPEHFFNLNYGKVWGIGKRLKADMKPVDLTTLYASTGSDMAETMATITETLLKACGSGINAACYADLVLEAHAKRKALEVFAVASNDLIDNTKLAQDVAEYVQAELKRIKQSNVGAVAIADHRVAAEQAIANRVNGVNVGVGTGYVGLDRLLCGMKPQTMTVLAARPSVGKTTLALCITANVCRAREPGHVLFFSLEQSARDLTMRLIAAESRQNLYHVDNEKALLDASDTVAGWPMLIDERGGLGASAIQAEANRIALNTPLSLIIIDRLELISGRNTKDNLTEMTTFNSGQMKSLAKELNVPVLLLCQLNRRVEHEHRLARLSDLRQSGAIEQDATAVLLLNDDLTTEQIPDYVQTTISDAERQNLVLADVAKNQDGPTGEVLLRFHRCYTRFDPVTFGVTA